MSVNCFVDTNVFVYYRDATEGEKQRQASHWLTTLWKQKAGRISHQVLNEYYVTVTQRLQPGLNTKQARADVRHLFSWEPVSIDHRIIEAAWLIQDRYRLSWWDSLIVAAAQTTNCDFLLTEDMQHEQKLDGLEIINPFKTTVERVF